MKGRERVRWSALFADLEAQGEASAISRRAVDAADRARAEGAATTVPDRMRAAIGTQVRVRCLPDVTVTGVLGAVGPDWVVVDEGTGREALIRTDAVVLVTGLSRRVTPPDGEVDSRLGIRAALRALARDRSSVRVHLVEGTTVAGTIDRVGADHVDLAIHPVGEARRRGEVRDSLVVRTAAIALIRVDPM